MRLHRDVSGFTIIEILMAVGLLSFLTAATLGFSDIIRHDIIQQRALAARNTEQSMFVSLMGQPAYVGALAGYEQNKALRECLDADGVLCEIKKDYALTNYDFAHGNVVTNAAPENSELLYNEFSFQVHCPLNQPTCDQADFISVKVRSSIKTSQGLQFAVDKVVVVQPKRSNVITMVPNTKLEKGSPINIIIFLDGSNSMSGIQASFKATLEKLLDQFKDLDATVFLLPLSGHAWSSTVSSSYQYDFSGNKVPLSWTDLSNAPGGTVRYIDEKWVVGAYKFNVSSSTNYQNIFAFTSSMTDADRQTTLTGLKAMVDKIFVDMGSTANRDASLCGLLRVLDDAANGLSPLTFSSTTPNVMMILTNEDDESFLVNSDTAMTSLPAPYTLDFNYVCATGIQQRWTKDMPRVVAFSDKMSYLVSGVTHTVLDGAPIDQPFTDRRVDVIKYRSTLVSGADCLADAKGIDKAAIDSDLGAGVAYDLSSCQVVNYKRAYVTSSGVGTHPCDAINATPANYPTVIPGTCVEEETPVTSLGWLLSGASFLGTYVPEDTTAHASGKMSDAIYNLLKKKFNLSNFLFTAVINPSSGVCPLTAGAHYGAKYEELVAKLGGSSQIIPICSFDYGTKLLDISTQLNSMGLNDFALPLGLGTRVSGVDILRGTTIVAATSGADYTISEDVVKFKCGVIQPTDVVRIYLK